MSDALIVSNLIQWSLVVLLGGVTFALARQVGNLNYRVAPAGALSPTTGPKIGSMTEVKYADDLDGNKIVIGGSAESALLVLFVSPTCPICRSLVPTAKSLARHEKLKLVFASDGDTLEMHRAYAADLNLDAYPYILSQEVGMEFGVSKLPFAVLLAKNGTLAAKGLVNSREHLESLVESMVSGISTLQDYMQELGLGSDASAEEEGSTDGAVKEYTP